KHELPLQGGLYTVKTRLPPGAYVKAVLLSAVDVGVGVNVSADPQPALLRLLGEGHLPNKACSHLKRCHIVGSTVGDLSSERAFIRLEKMSCIDIRTGQIIETDVSGYITGEDGKNGLAGVVVDRSGRMISRAMIVGLLSSVGNVVQGFAAAKLNESLASKLGNGGIQNNVMAADSRNNMQGLSGMGSNTGGAGSGVNLGGGAFDKLADYYIKRAEQLQPVIQINAGRVVHIVFTKGSNLGTENLLQAASSSTPKM
ncbi:MAG: TraB/VirB10 family protein, partial [Sedimentisphaerales bacterium]|nr:TraB/VirB10 family protein [Sedimentisphaerales bacterium]